MSLTAVAETFKAGKDTVLTLGTVTGFDVMDGDYKIESSVDEMTGKGSGGWYADVATVLKASGSIKFAYHGTNPPDFAEGSIYAIILDNPNGPYLAGNARVVSNAVPLLNVKGGVTYTVAWTSQGAMTKVRPGP